MSASLQQIAKQGLEITKQFDSIGQSVNGAFDSASDSTTQVAESIETVAKTANTATTTFDSATNSLEEYSSATAELCSVAEGAEAAFGQMGDQTEELEQGIKGLENGFDGLEKGIDGVGDEVDGLGKKTKGLEDDIDGLADTTQASIGDISSAILSLSNDTGKAAEGLADATYQAISAGVSTAGSVEFAGQATKLAMGGFTEAATAVDVLSTAINAYGLASSDAMMIADMLITTQNLGKTTVDELAASVGKVIPLASAYSVEIDNLSTGYAVLTANGVATAEAGTYLKSMLAELGTSSSMVSKTLVEETGMAFAGLMEAGYSLGDVLTILGDSVDNDSTAFAGLWGSIEAGIGALSIFNSGGEKFNFVLEQMRNSTGATEAAFNTMANTTAEAKNRMTNAMTNLEIVIGDQLNPALTNLYDAGASAFSWMGDFIGDNPEVTAAIVAVATALGVVTTAAVAYKAAITVATIASKLFHETLKPNPIFLIVTAITAVTAALGVFSGVVEKQKTEYETWTESTQKQYDELDALNVRYEETCETFGETSYEAQELKWQVDELSDSFEKNKNTVEGFLAECDELVQSVNKATSGFTEAMEAIDQEGESTITLIEKIEELASQSSLTAGEQEELCAILQRLDTILPNHALAYDKVTGALYGNADALKKTLEIQMEQEKYELRRQEYPQHLERKKQLEEEQRLLLENIALEKEAAMGTVYAEVDNMDSAGVLGYTPFIDTGDTIDNLNAYEVKLAGIEAELKEVDVQIQDCEQGFESYAQTASNAGSQVAASMDPATSAVNLAIGSIEKDLVRLELLYESVYLSAKTNIDNTVGLFDTLKTESKLSVADMEKAFQSQIAFLETYRQNIEKAEKYGISDELISQLSDGTAESAGQLDAIIKKIEGLGDGAKEFVQEFNASFDAVEEGKEKFATTVAEIESGFAEALDKMEDKLTTSVDNMNLGAEAEAAAKATIDGYIRGIKAKQESGVAAIVAFQSAAVNVLNGKTARNSAPPEGEAAYAVGTDFASPGFALVGEKGPEIVQFDGGERVYTADETNRILSSAQQEPRQIIPDYEKTENGAAASMQVGKTEKRIILEIAGGGELKVDKSLSKESVIDLLYQHIKPVLSSIVRQEIFEEGELAYDY